MLNVDVNLSDKHLEHLLIAIKSVSVKSSLHHK